MSVLFAISILSFCALLWASISIARHIRASSHLTPLAAEPTARGHHVDRPHQANLNDLNDPPLSRRIRQNPVRTPPNESLF